MAYSKKQDLDSQDVLGEINRLADEVDLKSADTAVVHDTGAETVAGAKTFSDPIIVPTYTVAGAPATPAAGSVAYISNGAAGSPILAFGDGTNWKRSDTGGTIAAA